MKTDTRPSLETLVGKKNLIGAEIGVYNGDNARYILNILDIQKLYLVDRWDMLAQYIPLLHEYKNNDKVELIKRYSNEAVFYFKDESLDFIYIDANHEYEYVVEDIKLWTPKVKIGGLIAGHDYISSPGVRKAVQETYKGFCQCEEDWWVIKGE